MMYLLNSPVLTGYGTYKFNGPITTQQAKTLLATIPFTSAIGHQATADLLSALLDQPIACQRIQITMQPGDSALVFRLLKRMPEGVVISKQQLNQLEFELGILKRV